MMKKLPSFSKKCTIAIKLENGVEDKLVGYEYDNLFFIHKDYGYYCVTHIPSNVRIFPHPQPDKFKINYLSTAKEFVRFIHESEPTINSLLPQSYLQAKDYSWKECVERMENLIDSFCCSFHPDKV